MEGAQKARKLKMKSWGSRILEWTRIELVIHISRVAIQGLALSHELKVDVGFHLV